MAMHMKTRQKRIYMYIYIYIYILYTSPLLTKEPLLKITMPSGSTTYEHVGCTYKKNHYFVYEVFDERKNEMSPSYGDTVVVSCSLIR